MNADQTHRLWQTEAMDTFFTKLKQRRAVAHPIPPRVAKIVTGEVTETQTNNNRPTAKFDPTQLSAHLLGQMHKNRQNFFLVKSVSGQSVRSANRLRLRRLEIWNHRRIVNAARDVK